MSADEDTELRDLVAQTLEANGTLGKLRAQLRASVFLALEEQESVQNRTPFLNKDLKKFLSTKDGRLVTNLVREFLDFFQLEFTAAVFDPETGLSQTDDFKSRDSLAQDLNLNGSGGSGEGQVPLIMELLRQSRSPISNGCIKSNASEDKSAIDRQALPKALTEKQIEEARQKFDEYDRDGSGAIDKDELRELFLDMFPSFNKNMLERYVNDEFRAVDKDFSCSIDFDEFLGMYKRLFLQCRSVVAGDVESILSPTHQKKAQITVSAAKSGSVMNSVEAKNQRNLEKSAPPLPSTPPPGTTTRNGNNIVNDLLGGDNDSFFDDFMPSGGLHLYANSDDKGHGGSTKIDGRPGSDLGEKGEDAKGAAGSSMTSLGDLPTFLNAGSLTAAPVTKQTSGTKGKEGDSTLRSLDRRMADMGLDNDAPDDFEYEDDFQSSLHSLSHKSGSKTEGQDKTENGSVAEEIDDEDIQDGSIEVDDLLKSEHSGFEDMTEDRSISQVDGGFDYMEDPQLP